MVESRPIRAEDYRAGRVNKIDIGSLSCTAKKVDFCQRHARPLRGRQKPWSFPCPQAQYPGKKKSPH